MALGCLQPEAGTEAVRAAVLGELHRLTQAILRARLTPAQAAAARACSEAILTIYNPGNVGDPMAWPRWARLVPHLLVADDMFSMPSSARNPVVTGSHGLPGEDVT